MQCLASELKDYFGALDLERWVQLQFLEFLLLHVGVWGEAVCACGPRMAACHDNHGATVHTHLCPAPVCRANTADNWTDQNSCCYDSCLHQVIALILAISIWSSLSTTLQCRYCTFSIVLPLHGKAANALLMCMPTVHKARDYACWSKLDAMEILSLLSLLHQGPDRVGLRLPGSCCTLSIASSIVE